MQNSFWNLDRIMKLIFVVSTLVILFLLLNYLSDVLIPFGVAFLLAYILDPIVRLFQKKIPNRAVASILVLVLFLLLTVGSLSLLLPAIVNQTMHLGDLLARAFEDASWRARLLQYIPENWWERVSYLFTQEQILTTLQRADFWGYAQSILSKVLPGAWGVVSGTARFTVWFLGLAMILVYLTFMLVEFGSLRGQFITLIPISVRSDFSQFAQDFDRILSQYFRAQTLVAGSVGILFSISFSIMGLPLGLPFGLLIGLLNMVPYLQLTSLVPALFLSLVYSLDTGMPFWQVILIVLAIYVVIQLIQDMILVPRIMGNALGLSPAAILLSLTVWGKLLGLLGMLLAIPFTCILLATWQNLRRKASV